MLGSVRDVRPSVSLASRHRCFCMWLSKLSVEIKLASIPSQIASPARARAEFERASPVLAQSGPVRDLTGLAQGFERGPHGQPAQARMCPYKSRLGPVRDMHGQISAHSGPLKYQ